MSSAVLATRVLCHFKPCSSSTVTAKIWQLDNAAWCYAALYRLLQALVLSLSRTGCTTLMCLSMTTTHPLGCTGPSQCWWHTRRATRLGPSGECTWHEVFEGGRHAAAVRLTARQGLAAGLAMQSHDRDAEFCLGPSLSPTRHVPMRPAASPGSLAGGIPKPTAHHRLTNDKTW